MTSAARAANIILERASREGKSLSPLQVMKLVYMAHGLHLATRGSPLLNERVQAWQYGPVIPSLYQHMKQYGNRPIHPPRLQLGIFDRAEPTADEVAMLHASYDAYGAFSGPALSNLTHRPGSPWSQVWRPGISNLEIPDEVIRRHYQQAQADGVLKSA